MLGACRPDFSVCEQFGTVRGLQRRGILGQPGNEPTGKNSKSCLAGHSFGEPGSRDPRANPDAAPAGILPQPLPAGAIFRDLAVSRPRRPTANGGRIMSDRTTETAFPIPLRRPLQARGRSRRMRSKPNCRPRSRASRCCCGRRRLVAAPSHAGPGIRASAHQRPAIDRQPAVAAKPDRDDIRSGRAIDDRGSPCRLAGARASPAASARSSGPRGVQGISPAPVRGSFGPAVPGRQRLRHRGRGRQGRNPHHAWRSRWASSSTS